MTEMSPAFRKVIRTSAFTAVGIILVTLAVHWRSNRGAKVATKIHFKSPSINSGLESSNIARGIKEIASGPNIHNVPVSQLGGTRQTHYQNSQPVGQVTGISQHSPMGQPTSANTNAAAAGRFLAKDHLPVEPKQAQKDESKSLPDLVSLNLDDGSLPAFPRKPAHSNENELLAKSFLLPNMVPGVIHYLWCGNRWFGFKFYLSLLSAIKAIKPDKVVFHYEYEPQRDKLYYHQWWDNLIKDVPFLYLHQLDPKTESDVCNGPISGRIKKLMTWLDYDGGGIYIGESTWLINFTPELRLVDFDYAITPDSIDGYIILRGGGEGGVLQRHNYTVEYLLADKSIKSKKSGCGSLQQLYSGKLSTSVCLNVVGHRMYDFMTPMNVWELEDPFGRLVRNLYYGTEEILKPKPSYDELVPNIGHMIWIGGGKMDFLFYLSLLSKLYILKVDVVYIHGDAEPAGIYWAKLKANKRIFDRIKFIIRPPPYKIYQGDIEWYYRALMSDLIRVDIMIKYGGIYTDTDAIWTKPLSMEERGYDAVASFDWVDWSYPFPDSVNFGVSYGKRNAPFWRIFRESMRELHNDIHGFTGVMMPYKLLEKYPHLLRIDKHLQAICYQQKCHPTYIQDYHNETNNHVTTNSIPNWKEDLHSLHWTHPNPPEYANETTLMAATGMFADVAKHVLKSAGLL